MVRGNIVMIESVDNQLLYPGTDDEVTRCQRRRRGRSLGALLARERKRHGQAGGAEKNGMAENGTRNATGLAVSN